MTDSRFPGKPQGRPSWSAGKQPEALPHWGVPAHVCLQGALSEPGGAPRAGECGCPVLCTLGLALLTHDWAREPGPRRHMAPQMRAHGAGSQQACGPGSPMLWEESGQHLKPLPVWALPQTPGSTGLHSNSPQRGAVTLTLYGSPPAGDPCSSLMSRDSGCIIPSVPVGLVPGSCVSEAPGPCPEPAVLSPWLRPASLSLAGLLAGVPFSGVDAMPSPAPRAPHEPQARALPLLPTTLLARLHEGPSL